MSEELLKQANEEARKRKIKLKNQAREIAAKDELLAKLQADLEKRTKERDDLDAKLKAQPEDVRAELEALKAERRTEKHRAAFDKLAKGLGANETALDDLYKVSGYQADADDVDEAALQGLLETTLKEKAYFLAPKAEAAPEKPQKLQAGPGVTRGSTASPTMHRFTSAEIRSIAYSPRKAEYMDAVKAGTVEIVQ